jgi:uncharacterized membrane protein YeiB
MTTTSDHDPGMRTGRRIGEVDALRGFALFGILIANVIDIPRDVTRSPPPAS